MATLRVAATPITTQVVAGQLCKATQIYNLGLKPVSIAPQVSCLAVRRWQNTVSQRRQFSSTSRTQLKEKQWFPPTEAPCIRYAGPAWPHPVYTEDQMSKIQIAHREAKTWSDKFALALMRLARFGMDMATGYADDPKPGSGKSLPPGQLSRMTERKWLIRLVFLESIAGVPGMVAGMIRHLHSLRRMRRDNGWIETLLEEAYNERMHLLTFLKIAEPGWFMKTMILGAQGVFFNGMFLSYLISPRTCHRFVGYLEEEAVYTYTRIINDIEAGKLPKWSDPNYQIPDIAVRYWNIPEGKRTMRNLMMYVRADEAKHREVNHTLGNLEQVSDPNPFVSEYVDSSRPHPTKGIDNIKPTGWERQEVFAGTGK